MRRGIVVLVSALALAFLAGRAPAANFNGSTRSYASTNGSVVLPAYGLPVLLATTINNPTASQILRIDFTISVDQYAPDNIFVYLVVNGRVFTTELLVAGTGCELNSSYCTLTATYSVDLDAELGTSYIGHPLLTQLQSFTQGSPSGTTKGHAFMTTRIEPKV